MSEPTTVSRDTPGTPEEADALPRALPAHAPHPPLRGRGPVALPAGARAWHHAPVLGPGGGARRRVQCAGRRGSRGRHLPRPRPRAGARSRARGADGRAAGARDRGVRGAGRLHERHRPRAPARGLLRDRGRQHRRGHGRRARAQAPRRRGGRLLRRRRHQSGLLPRVPELRQGPGPPGRLRLREQPLRRVHALRERHGGGDPRARQDARPADGHHRRQRRLDGERDRGRRPWRAPARAAARSSSSR